MARSVIHAPVGPAAYDIILGDGILAELPDLLASAMPARHYAVIADSTVAELYAGRVHETLSARTPVTVATFPSGERNKTRETWGALTDHLLEAGVGRDGAIVALGGGVCGDLAGFVAATYLRGVPYAQVPTTLLAMIDSSIGGKTGVDTSFGKNLVGAFHQPRLVAADVDTLRSLPRNQLVSGLAEALKHAYIADPELLHLLELRRDALLAGDPETQVDLIDRSIRIKLDVVSEDEREAGRRATLNFGHTVAHALEAMGGYALLHGEAVAIGMVAEAAIGAAIGVCDSQTAQGIGQTVQAFGLPTDLPEDTDPKRLVEVMRGDKKSRGGAIRFALIERPGVMARGEGSEWTIAVPEPTILAALKAL